MSLGADAVTAPIPERHKAGRTCATVAAMLAALTTLTAAFARRKP